MSLQHRAVKEHTCERSQAGPACQSAAVVTEHWAAEGGCSRGAPGAAASTSTPALIAKCPALHGTAQTSAHTSRNNISTTNWIYQQYWDRSLCKVGTAVVQDGCQQYWNHSLPVQDVCVCTMNEYVPTCARSEQQWCRMAGRLGSRIRWFSCSNTSRHLHSSSHLTDHMKYMQQDMISN